jgi:hypothetical protein
LREQIESALRAEAHFLDRAAEEILSGELSVEVKKHISAAILPLQKMNMPEYRKAIMLRKILFGSRQKTGLPGWVFEFMDEKIEVIDRRIAERFRADLPKKLLANASVF